MSPLTAFLLETRRSLERRRARLLALRGITAAGTAAVLIELVLRVRPLGPRWLAAVAAGAMGLALALVGWLRGRPSLPDVAGIADRKLGGAQRLATALEMVERPGALVAAQRSDTEAWIVSVDPSRVAAGRFSWSTRAGALGAAALAIAAFLVPNPARAGLKAENSAQDARNRVADEVVQFADAVDASERQGGSERRRQVVRELKATARALRKAESNQSAVAALSRGQQALSELGGPKASGRKQAASAAGAELGSAGDAAEARAAGAALAQAGEAGEELERLTQSLPALSEKGRAELASRLRDASDTATGREAERLRSAADDLLAGRTAEAQDTLAQAVRDQRTAAASQASEAIEALGRRVSDMAPQSQQGLARALEQAASAAQGDQALAAALARTASALAQGDPNEAEGALRAAAERAADLPAESALDAEIARAESALQEQKPKLLRCGAISWGAGGPGQPASAPALGPGSESCTGSPPKKGERPAPGAGADQGGAGSGGAGGGQGQGQGSGDGAEQAGSGGEGENGTGGRNGASGTLGDVAEKANEQVFVPGITGQGRTRDLSSSSSAPGVAGELLPYDSVSSSFRAAALSQAERQAIPEGRRELLRRYFEEPPP